MKNKIKLVYIENFGQVYVDQFNNMWDARYYTIEEATKLAKTMKESTNNYNCSNLTNCNNCIECDNCFDCEDCEGCSNLRSCKGCCECFNAYYLENENGVQ